MPIVSIVYIQAHIYPAKDNIKSHILISSTRFVRIDLIICGI